MRTITFRGYSKAQEQWLYGYYIKDRGNTYVADNLSDKGGVLKYFIVDPDSIGQYTGMTTRDGVEIYEGDILSTDFTPTKYAVKFYAGQFLCKPTNKAYRGHLPTLDEFIVMGNHISIIGNAYANLKEENEEE